MTESREHADRLARLQSRRAAAPPIDPLLSPAPVGNPPPAKRTSLAAGTKIAVAGAAASAVLGITAVLGVQHAQAQTEDEPAPAYEPTPSTLAAPVTAPQPQIVVVVVPSGQDSTELPDVQAVAQAASAPIAPARVDLAVPEVARPPAPQPQATSEGS